MEHAKKFVLIEPAIYAKMQESHVHAEASAAIRPSIFQNEVKDILERNEADDVKAKHYQMAMKKFRVREPVKYVDAVDESEILESVSTSVRHKAKQLVRIVKENPYLTWNERGELIHKQTTLAGSNIIDLVTDILKQKRSDEERPIGWLEFADGLAESKEINKDLVPNYVSWKIIKRKRQPETPVIPQAARQSRSRTRRRRITPRISDWEDY